MSIATLFAAYTEADARPAEFLALAEKAIQSGSFEKSLAYSTLARAWQEERAHISNLIDEGRTA